MALAFARGPHLFLEEIQCLSSLYLEGRVLVPLTITVEICVPRVLPAWHDSISGGEGGSQYSGTDEFWVTPSFISMSNPPGPLHWAVHCSIQPVSRLQRSSQGRGLPQEALQVTGWLRSG